MSGAENSAKMDPTLRLNDELMVHIFSFVGGQLAKAPPADAVALAEEEAVEYVEEEVTDEEAKRPQKKKNTEEDKFLDVLEAGRFYFGLARVSSAWKKIIDGAISHLATNISLSCQLSYEKGLSCMTWLGTHKMNIGSFLPFGRAINWLRNFDPSVFLNMLRDCDTRHMKDLTFALLHEIPQTQLSPRQFLDEIAEQCPNLKRARLLYCVRSSLVSDIDTTLISPSFFSLASLNSLDLTLDAPVEIDVDTSIITRMVESFPTLEYLFLNDCHPTIGRDSAQVFPIRSKSLKQILVENFTRHVKLSLDCPKLEIFRCRGFMSHPPPGQPPDRIALQQQVVRADNVPESCLALMIHVCNPNGPPIGFPFHQLLGPNVSLLPLRNHHG